VSESNVFGRAVSGAHVEAAIVDYLTKPDPDTGGTWISTGLGEAERLHDLAPGSVQRPLGIVTASQFEKWPEDQLPVVVVIAPGLARPPVRKGRGALTMTWAVGVAGIVTDVDDVASRLMGQVYALAISIAVNGHKSLNGFASKTEQLDERYDDLDFDDGRTLGAGRCVFEITVEDARTTAGGPLKPLPEPDVGTDPGPWPPVTDVSIDVTPKPITEDVRT
jgi:hypothetical protein